MSTTSRLLQIINHFRQQLIAREDAAVQALEAAYAGTLVTINARLEQLYQQIEEKQKAGETVPVSWLYESDRLKNITQWIDYQISLYAPKAHDTTVQLQQYGAHLGIEAAKKQLEATVPPGIRWTWATPSVKAIARIVGATQKGSPLAELFAGFGREAAKTVERALIAGVTLGWHPSKVAPMVERALDVPRWRALMLVRTEQIRAFRGGSQEMMRANSNVCKQWRWTCAKSPKTCPACLAMDGELFDLDEDMGSHPSCFPAGTLITTKRGLVAIENIKQGDEVLTHKGRYKRVLHTSQRPYSGEMIELSNGDRSVIATSNHPFLIEREGKLNWIEAGDIQLTDHVICQVKSSPEVDNHFIGDTSIKRGVRQSNNFVPSALKDQGLSSIARRAIVNALVPINTINFQHDIKLGQVEVYRITPSWYRILLFVFNLHCLQAHSRPRFWLRFTDVRSVTSYRAIPINFSRRSSMEGFAARLARFVNFLGLPTFIRAMFDMNTNYSEYLTAYGASLVGGSPILAWDRAKPCFPRLNSGWRNIKGFPTRFTNALNLSGIVFPQCSDTTFSATIRILSHPNRIFERERFTAICANTHFANHLDPSMFSSIISDLKRYRQEHGMVYNFEVEDDHSYVANGFVVHNCRCAPIVITAPWSEILDKYGIDSSGIPESRPINMQTGEEWFKEQSVAIQKQILGSKARYELWKSKDISLMDMVAHHHSDDWGASVGIKPLRELAK